MVHVTLIGTIVVQCFGFRVHVTSIIVAQATFRGSVPRGFATSSTAPRESIRFRV